MLPIKKLLLIVNPCAGQRRAKKSLCDVIDIFNRAGYMAMTYITAGPGDGEAAAMKYAAGADMVVCCGGDGTFNEVMSGMLKSGEGAAIGYIPTGTTNDFASSLRLSADMPQAARDIVAGESQWLDVGRFNGRYFSYIASFGAFTKSSYSTPQSVKNILGHTAYLLNGIQEISQLRSCPMRFELPGGRVLEDSFIFGAVSNSTSIGGVLTLANERVDLCDGRFELLLIRAPKDFSELTECVRALQHKTYDCPMLTLLHTARVSVSAPKEVDWALDGEWEPGSGHIEIECIHRAMRVYCGNTPKGGRKD